MNTVSGHSAHVQAVPVPTVPVNGMPVSLAEFVDDEARSYRDQGTPHALFVARQLERLAQLVRWTNAKTPEDHEARMEVWDDDLREQWYDRGFADGQMSRRVS